MNNKRCPTCKAIIPIQYWNELGMCTCPDKRSCFHGDCTLEKTVMGRPMLLNRRGYISLFDENRIARRTPE